jgi:hypothetical protein
MGILLGFAPFIVFALLTNVAVDLALWAAFATAFVLSIRDFAQTRVLRILDVGGTALFGLLALYAGFVQPGISLQAVRFVVDCGLLLIAVYSMVSGNPFTLQYAREQTPPDIWDSPVFIRTNYIITSVWTIAFLTTTAADGMATFDKKFPLSLDIAVGLASLAVAVIFTARYPAHVRERTLAGAKSRNYPR